MICVCYFSTALVIATLKLLPVIHLNEFRLSTSEIFLVTHILGLDKDYSTTDFMYIEFRIALSSKCITCFFCKQAI